jgi:ribulose 1,5-bisphosphate synthetase/thiazole synthase
MSIIVTEDIKTGDCIGDTEKITVIESYDVIVVGAGVAGIAAAVGAARNGRRTLLVERDGCVGGTATTGLMVVFMGVNLKILRGAFAELIKRLDERKGVFVAENAAFDPEIFKIAAEEWLLEEKVDILYHAVFSDVLMDDTSVKGIILQLKEGRRAILSKVVIDTTGDADVAAASQVSFQVTPHIQPMTSVFRMDRVETPKVIKYIEEHPDQFFSLPGQKTWYVDRDPPVFTLGGFFDLIKKARKSGELYLPHDSIWLGPLPRSGQYFINTTRIQGLNGTSSIDLSKAEIEMRKQAWSTAAFLKKYVPGFEYAELLDVAVRVGVRETRRIIGEYILTKDDLINGAKFDDVIAVYDFPMDIHGPAGMEETHDWKLIKSSYEIPYRVLVPQKIDNILVGGRCISVDTQAHGSTRAMPCCMATGEAAGAAAALACNAGTRVRDVDIKELQKLLKAQGVFFQ